MDDLISKQKLIKAINTWPKFGCDERGKLVPWNENYVPYIHLTDAITAINGMPSAEPQTEINMAYMRGKIDGINYCTERLREMRMEVEHD